MDNEFGFCVFCEAGSETKVEAWLKTLGYTVVTAVAERLVYKNGKSKRELRPIIPGYVFFTAFGEPDWDKILGYKYVFYALSYADKTRRLRGSDLEFIRWLIRYDGVIGIAKAIETGTRITIVDGALKDYEGSIIKVNRRRKCAAIRLSTDSIINTVWLSYDLIKVVE